MATNSDTVEAQRAQLQRLLAIAASPGDAMPNAIALWEAQLAALPPALPRQETSAGSTPGSERVPVPVGHRGWADDDEDEPMPDCSDGPKMPEQAKKGKGFWDFCPPSQLDKANPNHEAAVRKFIACIERVLECVADWRRWGLWAEGKINALVAYATKMQKRAERAEAELATTKYWEQAKREYVAYAESQLSGVRDATKEYRGILQTMLSSAILTEEQADEFLKAAKLISGTIANAEDHANSVYKEAMVIAVQEAKEEAAAEATAAMPRLKLDAARIGYHEAMTAAATEVQDPKYTMPFGYIWHAQGGTFVPNPDHPYWRGFELAESLKEADALKTHGYWKGAWERMPGYGVSLQHPVAVSGKGCYYGMGYWAGIRHGMESTKGNWQNSAFPSLPKSLEHLAERSIAQPYR